LSDQELRDLFRYISSDGKLEGPPPVFKGTKQ
jgi:hypothetical protein